ncbi:hypothetical protein B0G76_0779 [Paraburkholderia sp. BL23I1N1]|nr:hypothetical protein B0G76_0779 [Paraburkholderia sp. BL23I1N1]
MPAKYSAKGEYLCTACVESRFTGSLMFPPAMRYFVSVGPKELSWFIPVRAVLPIR